jgi:hypothetical protein
MDRHHDSNHHRLADGFHRGDRCRRRRPGVAVSAAIRSLLHGSTVADRAPILSVIYLICYSAAAFPSLLSGQLSSTFSLPQIALGYGGLALLTTLFTIAAARNPTG